MNHAPRRSSRSPDETPAFLVGITGYMDLREEDADRAQTLIRRLFRFLRHGPRFRDPDAGQPLLDLMVNDLAPDLADRELRNAYREALAGWPPLEHTPIIVMSGLAPGADTLAVEVALEWEFSANGFFVRTPLPFPADLYREATTFVREHHGVPDPQNAERQKKYDEVLASIGEQNAFAVRLAEDVGKSSEELDHQFRHDRDCSESKYRHRRYYAAGDYLANYCHLLVAVWDGRREESQTGTAAVVEARLRGPRPGVLPQSQGLQLAAGGPLLHIFARRPDAPGAHGGELTLLRFLHPYAFSTRGDEGGDFVGAGQERDTSLQSEYLAMFCRTAANLETFNEESPRPGEAQKKEFCKRLTYRDEGGCSHPFAAELEAEKPDFARALRRVSNLRLSAAHANGLHDKKVKHTAATLFFLALLAVVSHHIFAHWPREHEAGGAEGHGGRPAEAAAGEASADEPAPAWGPVVAGFAAVVLAGGALAYFAHQDSQEHAERGHDYRALAEGLRVQFYWNLAGLGGSVSANYMQRQRSELDWLRAAIRAVNFPYEQWSDYFAALPRGLQITALRCVAEGWIDDQFRYFNAKYSSHHHEHHAWHALGKSLALAGVISFAFWWLAECWHGLRSGLETHARWWTFGGLGLLVLTAAVGWALGRLRRKHEHDHALPRFQAAVFALVPGAAGDTRPATGYCRRLVQLTVCFFGCIPFSLALTAASLGLLGVLKQQKILPDMFEVGIILIGFWLVAGGLAVAWAEKNQFSELAYQYHVMAGLFGHARQRLKRDLQRLESHQGDDKYAHMLREVQDFLYSLGREALDENAEWLLLHRARPLEPVMGG
ncbi:MAG TPA: hypothetical protein VG826_35080 [Pirellulales bacterium]|nr:hypothetical protein [Pirellulales bacterium]